MIEEILKNIKEFYYTNQTKDLDFRIEQLKKLKSSFKKYEPEIVQALKDDLRKPEFEIYTTEFGPVIKEIDFAIRHLKKWARPEKAGIPVFLKPAKGCVVKEPYGTALIIVPFNYPMQLAFIPLVGAIAAGNCAVVKASRRTPECAKVICKIIADAFNPDYVKCLLPTETDSNELINSKFDYIFFTGSTETGKEVAQAAAKHLIPYTLELGGKSPVIVDKTANIELAAKKITWGKFLNCGQTCIAPDFVLAHTDIKDKLVHEIIKSIKAFFGVIPQESKDYGRIVDERAFFKLKELISKENENIIFGGQSDECGLYIEPTLLNINSFSSPAMEEEIFGPILPIMTYSDIDEVIKVLREKPKPLALYVFTKDKDLGKKIIKSIPFGGGAVNDIMNHTVSSSMPFGGIGASGIGQYHGKYSFDTFTHLKSILIRNSEQELKFMYPPYDFETTKKIRKYIG